MWFFQYEQSLLETVNNYQDGDSVLDHNRSNIDQVPDVTPVDQLLAAVEIYTFRNTVPAMSERLL